LYFITSSDSGSLVVDMIAANGADAHVIQRVFWALSEGAVAIVLLASTKGAALSALRDLSIMAGLPLTIVLTLMTLSLWRALAAEADDANLMTWKMPLYGGIFDWVEYVSKLCKTALPEKKQAVYFLQGLFLPPWLVFTTLRKIRDDNKQGLIEDALLSVASGITFFFFILMHALQPVEGGLHGIGWTAYIAFTMVVSYTRCVTRVRYNIPGSGLEDFLATLVFYPQVIAQIAVQADEERKEQETELKKV